MVTIENCVFLSSYEINSIELSILIIIYYHNYPQNTCRILIKILLRFSSEYSHSSHQNPLRILIKFLLVFSLESSRDSHQKSFRIWIRFLKILSDIVQDYDHSLYSFSLEQSFQNSHQNTLIILNSILSRFLNEQFWYYGIFKNKQLNKKWSFLT